MHETIVRSCDTVYYQFAIDDWKHDEALVHAGKKPLEAVQNMARDFGVGKATGIDLPSESYWPVEDRAFKLHYWRTYLHRNACAGVKKHPPGSYLRRLDQENCTDGWRFEEGDQANFDIGQGTVLMTPLQLAVAYEALVNGGRMRAPRIGKAIVSAGGRLVRRIPSPVTGHIPVSQTVLDDIMNAMYGVTTESHGTASGAFAGFPMGRVRVGGKTGTAEAPHGATTSWFASFGGPPGEKPQYVVVAMIPNSGQGAVYAAPVVRQVWEGIYGIGGRNAALPNGTPPLRLPRITPDGTVHVPHPSPAPSGGGSSPSPSPSTGALAPYRLREGRR
jgi:penicillin-binding protein 2